MLRVVRLAYKYLDLILHGLFIAFTLEAVTGKELGSVFGKWICCPAKSRPFLSIESVTENTLLGAAGAPKSSRV